ncbi:MAG: DUF1501 domain-containing protein [Nannocystaceae bacterium]|nr:DUF1501 domain-containing protein [bacterium]
MISRRQFLGSSAALGAASLCGAPFSRANVATKARRLVTVFVRGGWDIAYSIDPKPELVATPEYDDVVSYENIPILTHASRPNIAGFFAEYASTAAVVHGIDVRSISHTVCRRKVLTGVPSGTGPDAGAMVANAHARDYPLPYLVVGSTAYTGPLSVIAGRVGPQGQINALIDPADAIPRPPESPYFHEGFEASQGEEEAIRAFLEARTARERATRGQWGSNRARIDDFVESMEKGELIRDNAEFFGTSGEQLDLTDQVELALTALDRDLAWSVGITANLGFDTHVANAQQGLIQDQLFGGLRDIAQALIDLDLFDDTVVVVQSEMSRTPALNAEVGKDHHPVTSALVFGGGIAGGEVYGGNGDAVEALPVDFETGSTEGGDLRSLDPASWVAGVAALAGADASEYLSADPFTAFIG